MSNNGGEPILCGGDAGGELYYRSGDKMMAVSVTTSPEFKAAAPTMLWEGDLLRRNGLLVRNARGRLVQLRRLAPTASGF